MRNKLVAALLAAGLGVTTLAGSAMTAFAEGDYTRADSEGVVVGVLADPENMGPWSGMSQGRIAALFSIYECMITREDGVAYGVLAKNWEEVDAQTYDVEIVRFHQL